MMDTVGENMVRKTFLEPCIQGIHIYGTKFNPLQMLILYITIINIIIMSFGLN